MKYSVVIPSNRTDDTINYTLGSLLKQTMKPKEIIIVADINFKNKKELEKYREKISSFVGKKLKRSLINNRVNKIRVGEHNASYIRNRGLEKVSTPYVLSIDDDNVFNDMFIEDIREKYVTLKEEEERELLIIPTELHRDTNVLRSQGFKYFNHRLGRVPTSRIETRQTLAKVRYCSSNCIFGATKIFKQHPFDEENFPFVYEDFDATIRMTNNGNPLYVLTQVYTHHMISKKTPLQISYINTKEDAFQKSKNRILFVRKNSNLTEKIQYFALGLRVHSAALYLKVLQNKESWSHAKALILAITRGIWKGLTIELEKSAE